MGSIIHDDLRKALAAQSSLEAQLQALAFEEAAAKNEASAVVWTDYGRRVAELQDECKAREEECIAKVAAGFEKRRVQTSNMDDTHEKVLRILDPLAPWNQRFVTKTTDYDKYKKFEGDWQILNDQGITFYELKIDREKRDKVLGINRDRNLRLSCYTLQVANQNTTWDNFNDLLTNLHLFHAAKADLNIVISLYGPKMSILLPGTVEMLDDVLPADAPGKKFMQHLFDLICTAFDPAAGGSTSLDKKLSYVNITYSAAASDHSHSQTFVDTLISRILYSCDQSPMLRYAGVDLARENIFVIHGLQDDKGVIRTIKKKSSLDGALGDYPPEFLDWIRGTYLVPEEARAYLLEVHNPTNDSINTGTINRVVQRLASISLQLKRDGSVGPTDIYNNGPIFNVCNVRKVENACESRMFQTNELGLIFAEEDLYVLNDYRSKVAFLTQYALNNRFFDPNNPKNKKRKQRPEEILPYYIDGTFPTVMGEDGKPSYLITVHDSERL